MLNLCAFQITAIKCKSETQSKKMIGGQIKKLYLLDKKCTKKAVITKPTELQSTWWQVLQNNISSIEIPTRHTLQL
jgi:hypothetical protein